MIQLFIYDNHGQQEFTEKLGTVSEGPETGTVGSDVREYNPRGDIIIISRHTHEVLGSPPGHILLYDRERLTLGLQPSNPSVEKNAYPAKPRGSHGGRRIRGYRAMREFAIDLDVTVHFHHCQIDNSGILILDLLDTRKIGRKVSKW